MGDVAITYTGREEPFRDRNYGTGLEFCPGQVRALPGHIARRFLRHADVFQISGRAGEAPAEEVPAEGDDTGRQLRRAQQQQDAEREEADAAFALRESILRMDKEALRDWASLHLNYELPARGRLSELQQRVLEQLDAYGIPGGAA